MKEKNVKENNFFMFGCTMKFMQSKISKMNLK